MCCNCPCVPNLCWKDGLEKEWRFFIAFVCAAARKTEEGSWSSWSWIEVQLECMIDAAASSLNGQEGAATSFQAVADHDP